MSIEWIYITLHVAFYGVFFTFALVGLYRKLNPDLGTVRLEDVTLIVPFRDEENTLPTLLNSLLQQEKLPTKLLFIDDHSSDGSKSLVRNQLNHLDFELLQLSDDLFGKKNAIQLGVNRTTTKYCLTLDADVHLAKNYFSDLELLEDTDMWILPVRMYGRSLIAKFASIDNTLSNILNRSSSVLFRPVLASGANLLFKTKSYRELSKSDHFNILSGDDMFLLRDFRQAGCDIRITADPRLIASTEAPNSIKAWFNQRIRWISKTSNVRDILPLVYAVINFSLGVFFYYTFLYLISIDFQSGMYLLLFKLFYDTLLMSPHFLSENNQKELILTPIYNLLLPIYSLILVTFSAMYKPKWKGRSLK